jgi:Zn-dependent protease with chaperone function
MNRVLLPLLATASLLAGCQSTTVAPATGADTRLEADERRLWLAVRTEEDSLLRSGFVASVPAVERYLDTLVARLHPTALPDGERLRVRVIADPTLNAFAMPTGALFIHTGLLARLENEAQLAAILAHELTHAIHRHGLRSYRSVKNNSAFASAVMVGTGGSLVGLLGALGAVSSAAGYSRDLEREADANGFQLSLAAGYDPREGGKIFRTLRAETERSKKKEPFFFGSHPRLSERISNFDEFLAALPPKRHTEGRTGADEFTAILPPILVLNAEVALHAGDLDFARDSATHARQLRPLDARAAFLLAEAHRRRATDADRAEALKLYRETVTLETPPPEAHRGLGLELLRLREFPAAAAAFRRYLELRPTAGDRGHIEEFLRQCENPT